MQPALIDTYAGLMLLSYMRFLATSVKLLKYTIVTMELDDVQNHTVAFYYDANLSYFGWPHAAYGVLAILCLLVFVVTPTIVLLLYHLKSFQRCLTRCKLDRPGLHALVDAYQGCFKNSATDGSERRYFAGIFLLFRFCYVVSLISTPSTSATLLVIIIIASEVSLLSIILAAIIVMLRPYKATAHNFTNFLSVVFLLVCLWGFVTAVFIPTIPLFAVVVCLQYIPFLVLCSYLTYRLLKPCCIRTICKNMKEENPTNDEPSHHSKHQLHLASKMNILVQEFAVSPFD